MNMVVFTTVIGNTDPLRSPTIFDRRCRYVCITDSPRMMAGKGWEIVPIKADADTCLQSRQIKILSHERFPKADVTLWLDAAYRLRTSPLSLLKLIKDADMVAMRHPHRNRITEEASALVRLGLAPEERLKAQLASYREQGFDTDDNPQQAITTTGFFLRRRSERVREFEKLWWEECKTHTYRDQMSIDYVIHRIGGAKIFYIPGHYRDNPYAKWHKDNRKRCHPHI